MPAKGQAVFHSGIIFLQDKNGVYRRGPTVQEISLDAKAGTKELMGENVFAEAFGRDNVKITGKFKLGKSNLPFTNAAFFNQTVTKGATSGREMVLDEAGTVASGTVTVAAGAAIAEDLGVVNPATGDAYTPVASAPAAGQYSVNLTTGVYTFNTSENGTALTFSYVKKVPGQILTLNNELAGEAPTFRLIASNKFQSQTKLICLESCVSDSFSFAWKTGDFSMPDYSFGVQAHPTKGLGYLSTTVQA